MKIAIFNDVFEEVEWFYNLYAQYDKGSREWEYGFNSLCDLIDSGDIVKIEAQS